jgi:hypothetical protein
MLARREAGSQAPPDGEGDTVTADPTRAVGSMGILANTGGRKFAGEK